MASSEVESVSLADIRSRMSLLEESVVKDPSPANIEHLKRKLEVLESLIASEKSRRLDKGRKRKLSHSSSSAPAKAKAKASTEVDGEKPGTKANEEKAEDWIRPGIVVKIMADNLGSHIYQRKGEGMLGLRLPDIFLECSIVFVHVNNTTTNTCNKQQQE